MLRLNYYSSQDYNNLVKGMVLDQLNKVIDNLSLQEGNWLESQSNMDIISLSFKVHILEQHRDLHKVKDIQGR